MGCHSRDRRLLKQIGCILERPGESLGRILHLQRQIKLCRSGIDVQRQSRDVRELQGVQRRVL